MKKEKILKKLLGPWTDLEKMKEFKNSKHKFLDRDRTLKINWTRLHTRIPEVLLNDKKQKVLDVASGNGATMEIMRYYGHDVEGVDFSPGFEEGDWLYRPMIESQGLKCQTHNCSITPYPFEDKEFDFVICYGAITFFKPIKSWPEFMDEFARISKNGMLIGVNVGKNFDEGQKYLDAWRHPEFKLASKTGSIYKWVKK